MSITDELRKVAAKTECANGRCEKLYRGDLEHIADRIDAEHEAACAEAYGNGVMSVPIALDESQWVKLPVDADGVPIRVGDSIEIIGGEDGVAVAIELCENGGWNVSMRPTGWDTPTLFAAESVRHHHEPTVEDVLREFAAKLIERGELTNGGAQTIAEYAAKLRLAGDAE